jgi:hypothetical protein
MAQRQTYRTMQGREIDFDKLRNRNETVLAVGNARVNARGDEIGPGGKIIKKREDVVAEYYEDNPNARGRKAAATAVVEDKPVEPTITKQTKKSEE